MGDDAVSDATAMKNAAAAAGNNSKPVTSHKDRLIGIIGLISTIVGGIAGAINNIAALKKAVFDVFGSSALLLLQDNMPLVVGICIGTTAIAICLWTQLKLLPDANKVLRPSRRTRITILWLFGALLAGAGTYYAVPSRPDVAAEVRIETTAFEKELVALKVNTGGMRYNRVDSSVEAQVWCTAQAVWAILAKPSSEITLEQAQVIRAHLEYMERMRLPNSEGWGYMEPINWGVTEISAWVALAYIASARSDVAAKVWPGDVNIPLTRIRIYLDMLTPRQMTNGGWSPVRSIDSSSYLRTYSTLMSIWAMIEAESLPGLKEQLNGRYTTEIENGMRWILTNYNKDRESAVPNPARVQQTDSFPGLTAQVLYVLERAKQDHEFVLQSDANYEPMRKNFIKTLEAPTLKGITALVVRDANSNDRTHDSDRYLSKSPYMVESSTFLWLPWSLAFCTTIDNQKLDGTDGRWARNGCELLTRRVKDLVHFAKEDPFVYVMAESLFALHLQLNSWQKQHPQKKT